VHIGVGDRHRLGARQAGCLRHFAAVCAAEAEYQRAHGLDSLQAEFQADGKHQEDDTELGEAFHLRVLGQDLYPVRAEGNTDGEVGQDRR